MKRLLLSLLFATSLYSDESIVIPKHEVKPSKEPKLAVIFIKHIDKDAYGKIMKILTENFHKLAIGGYLFIDDFCDRDRFGALQEFNMNNAHMEGKIVSHENGMMCFKRIK